MADGIDPSRIGQLFDLKGRVACVTGASSGLGRRAADILLAAGVCVVGIARREEMLEEWSSTNPQSASPLAGDLANKDSLPQLVERICEPFGPPEILINAAGINTREPADEVTEKNWELTLNLNLSTPFFLAKALVPGMRKKGYGRIINFASLQSYRAFPGGIAYGASKGGVAQLTRAMAEAWSKDGINANAVAPGFFKTELTEAVFSDPERAKRNAAQTCIGRNGDVEDIDGPILFLSSPASAYITGQVIAVDGGFTAK